VTDRKDTKEGAPPPDKGVNGLDVNYEHVRL
jgi:hypothetical protein